MAFDRRGRRGARGGPGSCRLIDFGTEPFGTRLDGHGRGSHHGEVIIKAIGVRGREP